MVIPLWSGEGEAGRYVAVEPLRKGGWKLSKITLLNRGPAPLRREQSTLNNPEETATQIRMALGSQAPQLERQAPWRRKPSSPVQQKTWRKLFPENPQNRRN